MKEIKDIELTNDPLTNIHIMAPYLNKEGQSAVFGLMFGLIMGNKEDNKPDKTS